MKKQAHQNWTDVVYDNHILKQELWDTILAVFPNAEEISVPHDFHDLMAVLKQTDDAYYYAIFFSMDNSSPQWEVQARFGTLNWDKTVLSFRPIVLPDLLRDTDSLTSVLRTSFDILGFTSWVKGYLQFLQHLQHKAKSYLLDETGTGNQ